MKLNQLFCFFVVSFFLCSPSSHAEEKHAETNNLEISPDLMDLLRVEMRAILSGIQTIPAGIATADWERVADISSKISSSYILAQKITLEQRQELQQSLPEHFKKIDENFHLEAEKLELAARKHDAQLVAFHYYRLIDSCTSCHAAYATSKFPGFLPKSEIEHHH